MIKEIIDCIPSKTMREYLHAHPMTLSVLQLATIVSEYAPKEQKAALFEDLLRTTTLETECLLLKAGIKDIKKYGYPHKQSDKVYDSYFVHAGKPPFYPFLEVCKLPVLFQKGDIIREGSEYFYVANTPTIIDNCDFTDECYLCYSLTNEIKSEYDLFSAHYHIHVCVAESASFDELSEEQKRVKESIVSLLKCRSENL